MIDAEIRELERAVLADPGDLRARRKLDAHKSRLDPTRLGSDQERAFEAIADGRNVLLTGAPGSGKSTVIQKLPERFPDKRIAVVASTGPASFRIGGLTLHHWAGILPEDCEAVLAAKPQNPTDWERFVAQRVRVSYFRSVNREAGENFTAFARRMSAVDILVLDEVSMTSALDFELAMRVIVHARGGKPPQVVLCGDFAQLLPVKHEERGLVFEAPFWNTLNLRTIELRELFRSIADPVLATMLADLRDGIVTDRTIEILKDHHGTFDPDEEGVVRLLANKKDVERINDAKLADLQVPARTFQAIDLGDRALLGGCGSPEKLVLKVGAKVAFTKNGFDEAGQRYVNGMSGEVRHVGGGTSRVFPGAGSPPIDVWVPDYDGPKIGRLLRVVDRETWAVWSTNQFGERTTVAQRQQYPFQLAWALTLHKAQGATLERVSCDLSGAWEFGHVYVALSRVRRLADLNIESMPNRSIDIDPRIKAWLHEGGPA